MLRYLTAGESHGPSLVGIIEGLPAGLRLDIAAIDSELARRQHVPGRGGRMNIEQDRVVVLGGLRGSITLGSPLALQIVNKDHANWCDQMDPIASPTGPSITAPRPGHADYPGAVKYGFSDLRNVLERASARETAMRTAIGAVAKQVLARAGIEIFGRVLQLGPVQVCTGEAEYNNLRMGALFPYGSIDTDAAKQADELINTCRAQHVSVGGVVEVAAFNVPVGLGSYVQADRRLDARLAGELMSIPGVKGVEIGEAFDLAASAPGTSGDSLCFSSDLGIHYHGNKNGGLAGGVTTGQPLVMRCAVKPVPTAMPGRSIDLISTAEVDAIKERSDTTFAPAVQVVAEAVMAWVLLVALLTDGPQANSLPACLRG